MGKSKKKKSKKSKSRGGYEPMGSVVGIDTTIIQAAALLDRYSIEAVKRNNQDMIVEAANGWVRLGELMTKAFSEVEKDHDHEHEDTSDVKGSTIMGFGNTEAREKAEAENRERRSKNQD